MRESPQLKRDMTIYLETLTPEQQQRLNQIEQEPLEAYDACEESRTKTVLKGKTGHSIGRAA
jgi:Spy/CpxP family protein refolding chaperone